MGLQLHDYFRMARQRPAIAEALGLVTFLSLLAPRASVLLIWNQLLPIPIA
jgi:hypothetical protein